MTNLDSAIAGGFVGGMLAIMLVCIFIFYILLIIADWKIFEKAGEKGWKALIPIYNIYIMYKIVNMKSWFWWSIAISICASLTFTLNGFDPYSMSEVELANYNYMANPVVLITLIIVGVINIYILVTYACRTAKAFGHGIGYTIGLLLLPNIFWLILGFGKSKYSKKALKK